MKRVKCIALIMFLLMHMVPIHGMFTSVRRLPSGSLRNVSNATSRVPSGTSRALAGTQELGKRSIHGTTGPSSSWMARQAAALKSTFSRWWAGKSTIPLEQKELSVPVSQVKQPEVIVEKPTFISANIPFFSRKSYAQIESEDIIAQLLRSNLLGSSTSTLTRQIMDFLEKNEVNAIENVFSHLITVKNGPLVLSEVIKKNNSFAVKILPLVEKYFDKIKDNDFIETVLLSIPSDQFVLQTDHLKEKFFERIQSSINLYRSFLLGYSTEKIYRLLPHDNKKCITMIAIINDGGVPHMMKEIEEKKFNEVMQFLRNIASQKIANLMNKDLKELIKKLYETGFLGSRLFEPLLGDNSRLQNIFVDILKTDQKSNYKINIFNSLSRALDGQNFLKVVLGIDNNYAQTQSYRHLVKFYRELVNLVSPFRGFARTVEHCGIMMSSVFNNMINECLNEEKKSADKKTIFYHARGLQYRFLTDLYEMFYEYKSGKSLGNFSFTQLIEPVINPSKEFIAHEKQKRERLIKEGNPFSRQTKLPEYDPNLPEQKLASMEQLAGFSNRQTLLFLNKDLFGNLSNLGSCSIDYVVQNHNAGEVTISIKEIFSMFGYGDIYHMYEKELDDLQKKHNNLSEHGELLQILIPKNKVDKCVYYTASGGPKKDFKLNKQQPGDAFVEVTADVKVILKDLDENPQDKVEFALVETSDPDGGLDPDSGIEVLSRNLVEPVKMAAYNEEKKPLLARILESCKQKDEQQKKEAIEVKKAQLAAE